MKRMLLGWGLGALLAMVGGGVASEPADPVALSYRYLIVLENSARMDRQREVALDTVHELILKGIQGQIQAGEVLGVWTFRDRVERDRFRPVVWAPGRARDVANDVYRTLRDDRFGREPDLDLAMAAVTEVAGQVDRLTVFLVVSGYPMIRGAWFDDEINEVYQQHADGMRQSRRPFVTVLVMDRGRTVAHATSPGGRTIYIPPAPEVALAEEPGLAEAGEHEPEPAPVPEVAVEPPVQVQAAPEVADAVAQPVPDRVEAPEPEPDTVDVAPKPKPLTVDEIERRLREAQVAQQRREAELAASAAATGEARSIELERETAALKVDVTTVPPPAPEKVVVSVPAAVSEPEPAPPGPMEEPVLAGAVEPEESGEVAAPGMILPESEGGRLGYLIAGLSLLGLGIVLVWWMYRESRPHRARPSAISRSMDRI
jgi:hypothetical protein